MIFQMTERIQHYWSRQDHLLNSRVDPIIGPAIDLHKEIPFNYQEQSKDTWQPHVVREGGNCMKEYPNCNGCPYAIRECPDAKK
jgi:hypothetical protein